MNCCFGCKDNEVTWRSNTAEQNDTCLSCIDCPDGMEPSIPCGTVAKYGTHLHCVACREGTYSDTYSKQQCKPCSLCSLGRTVARNCSATKNTRCGSCSHGYYKSEVVFDCLPCSICCWDGRDQVESQCKAQGLPRHRHCKPRHVRGCSQTALTTKEAIPGAINVRVNQATTQQTKLRETRVPLLPTTHGHLGSPETRGQNTTSLAFPTTESKLRKETVPTRDNTDKNNQAYNKSKGSVSDSNSEIKSRVIKAASLSMVILIAIVVIAKRKKLAEYFKWARCRPICRCSDIERGGETESSVLDDINAQLAMNVNAQLAMNVKAMGCKHIPSFYFPI